MQRDYAVKKPVFDATGSLTDAGEQLLLDEEWVKVDSVKLCGCDGAAEDQICECNTLTTKDRFALHHLQYAYGKPIYSNIEEPAKTITTNPKHELITTKWLFDTQFNRVGNSVDKPCIGAFK